MEECFVKKKKKINHHPNKKELHTNSFRMVYLLPERTTL